MIESCSRKQMIVAIGCLVFLSVVVILIENKMAPSAQHNTTLAPADNESLPHNCWKKETFKELQHCQPCTALELKSGSPKACVSGHYRQKIECEKEGVVYRRCDRAVWLEERHFLVFCVAALATACGGLGLTGHRQHVLQRRVMQRIEQQLIVS